MSATNKSSHFKCLCPSNEYSIRHPVVRAAAPFPCLSLDCPGLPLLLMWKCSAGVWRRWQLHLVEVRWWWSLCLAGHCHFASGLGSLCAQRLERHPSLPVVPTSSSAAVARAHWVTCEMSSPTNGPCPYWVGAALCSCPLMPCLPFL